MTHSEYMMVAAIEVNRAWLASSTYLKFGKVCEVKALGTNA